MAKKKKPTVSLPETREEQIALADHLIDRDARIWKQWVRDNEYGLSEFMSRRNDVIILRPTQR